MENRLKAIAVDDEFRALEVLERYAEKVPFIEWLQSFKNPVEALAYLKTEKVDLVFLDINMPDLSGTSLARLLAPDQQVIFTTAYSEFAVEGFSLDATDYLLKPIEFERFLKACLKAKEQADLKTKRDAKSEPIESKNRLVSFKSGSKTHLVDLNEILFFEKQGNDMMVHLDGREGIKTRLNMKTLFELLPKGKFCQTHKSFALALDRIETIESHQVIIKGHQIPIGRIYRESFLSQLQS